MRMSREDMRDYMRRRRAEKPEENRQTFRYWRERNTEKDLARCEAYRIRKAMEAVAQAKPSKPSPAVARMIAMAEAKATQARYGIERIAYS